MSGTWRARPISQKMSRRLHGSKNCFRRMIATQMFTTRLEFLKRTILAHCVHLSDTEVATIKARGSGISHCPTSNSSITSGEAPMRRYLDAGVKCSLGTDLSGGYAPSVLEVARQALLVSRHVAMKSSRGDADKLSVAEVLCLGTIGGAQVCEMADQLGSFEVGKKWDAQLIDLEVENSPVDVFEWQEPRIGEGGEDLNRLENLVAKWLLVVMIVMCLASGLTVAR